MSKFGEILLTPIWLTVVACYASGPLKVRLLFRSQTVLPPPPKPLHKHRHIRRYLVTAHFSQLTNAVLTLLVLIIAALEFSVGWNIITGLWSENSFLSMKVVSDMLYPYNSDKSNAQKSEIPTTFNVYSYRKAHVPAPYSAGVICRGWGTVTCNTQPSIY